MVQTKTDGEIAAAVKERYSAAAKTVLDLQGAATCCGDGTATIPMSDVLGYDPAETGDLPQQAVLASLGCGNPTALAELHSGETVLDLGSGGGIDVLLSAKRVGPEGYVYGLDMTDEMLELAEKNRAEAGIENVEFLKGQIEDIPLPDASVDVIVSNCVINLSVDKGAVLREAFRVLKPGGRFAVSDIVFQGEVPESARADLESWTGCVAGALEETEYLDLLNTAGFVNSGVEVTHVYDPYGASCCCGSGETSADYRAVSAFIRAQKPV